MVDLQILIILVLQTLKILVSQTVKDYKCLGSLAWWVDETTHYKERHSSKKHQADAHI